MGAAASQLEDTIPQLLSQIFNDEPPVTLITSEIHDLTYEKFISIIGELNQLSKKCLDANGKRMIFAVKKDTDSTVFWKATVQIACVKIDPTTEKVESYRLLSLSQFLKVFKTFKCQTNAAEQSKSTQKDMTMSDFFNHVDQEAGTAHKEKQNECCICLERKQEVILPCAHSYCLPCVEEWTESHDTCPICRETFESPNDTWVISEVPNAEEISKEIQQSLMELAEREENSSSSNSTQ